MVIFHTSVLFLAQYEAKKHDCRFFAILKKLINLDNGNFLFSQHIR